MNDKPKRDKMVEESIQEYLQTFGDGTKGVKVEQVHRPSSKFRLSEHQKASWDSWFSIWHRNEAK